MNADLQIIEKDIEELYLGNLKTVQFDLHLPKEGTNGSTIEWISEHERFLSPEGKVTRPKRGVGDRKVMLHAVFRYGNEQKEKIYEVNILEEPDETKVIEIYPLVRKCAPERKVYLPQSVVVKTVKGQILSYPVSWDGGNEKQFEKEGKYIFFGSVEGTEIKAQITVDVEESYVIPQKNTKCSVNGFTKGEVKLLPGTVFWENRQRDIAYLKSVDADQILYNFRQAAGLDTKGADAMTGWDSPDGNLRGHTSGHYLSAVALCYRETGDKGILQKIQYLIESLEACQKAFEGKEGFHPGYIGAYSEEQFDLLEQGAKYPEIWAPYYTLHKILAGLLDCYLYAGNETALQIALKSGRWVYNRLSKLTPELRASMWNTYIAGEFGGMNETMARLYEISGEACYLECAKMFDNDKLFVPMEERKDALERLHANQHIPQILGSMEIFKATGEKRYYDIAEFFWKAVTESHIYVNGGVGESEMFLAPDSIGRKITKDTAESCATYNMLKLTRELYQYDPKAFYMDYYERAVWNHMAGTFDKAITGESTYFFPLNPGAQREFLFENSCCHGTGMESQMKYTEGIYFQDAESIYVNLFISSELFCEEKGLTIVQNMDEKEPDKTVLHIKGERKRENMKIRKPHWCEGEAQIWVNGEAYSIETDQNGYYNISKEWEEDEVEVHFPCSLRTELTKDCPEVGAFIYGPYVLAVVSDQEEMLTLNETDTEKIQLLPLCFVDKEQYHTYHKIKVL